MQVEIRWSEQVTYRSTVDVDEDAIRLWLADEEPSKVDPEHVITAEEVKDYLESGDEDEWFEQTDTDRDFQGAEDRSIEEVIA